MEFDEYQKLAAKTAFYNLPGIHYKLMYLSMGLAGEAGEAVDKVKHVVRNQDGNITEEKRELLKKEIGDVLWYASQLALALGLSFDDIAQHNIAKLADRAARGVIQGEGDLR
ncbi:MAG: nucleoside triphosphate pyrophosphohydrolase family protein [bacterium]|nr:nucleoside triphosphate pyrophosphohydrolase family protein [bacterium]